MRHVYYIVPFNDDQNSRAEQRTYVNAPTPSNQTPAFTYSKYILECLNCKALNSRMFLWRKAVPGADYKVDQLQGVMCSESCFNMWLLKQM